MADNNSFFDEFWRRLPKWIIASIGLVFLLIIIFPNGAVAQKWAPVINFFRSYREFAGDWVDQMIAVIATAFIVLIGFGIYGLIKLIIHLIDEIKYETR